MAKQSIVTVKQNPIVIIKNLLLMEVGGYLSFVAAGTLADYGAIYKGLSFAHLLSYQSAEFLFIGLAEAMFTFLIFFSWFYTHYQITPEVIILSRGIFLRRKTTLPLDHIEHANAEYGLLGKIFGYGTLTLQSPTGALKLKFIPHPQRYAALVMRFRAAHERTRRATLPMSVDLKELLGQEEHEHLEFKTTMRWDMQNGTINRGLEKMVMKTIAAFLNSGGGQLVIGVDDRKNVLGLDRDYRTLTKQDRDGFENHFTHVFNSAIGAKFRQFVKLHFTTADQKDVCIVNVQASSEPAFARFESGEEFYVRTGNSTTPLKISEAASYLELWRKRFG